MNHTWRELLVERWPGATELAEFLGARLIREDNEQAEPVVVLQHWQHPVGVVVLAWPVERQRTVTGTELDD